MTRLKLMDLRSLVLFAVLAVFAGSATAAEDPGFYVGVGVGQNNVEIDDADFDEDDTGFKVFGGYQFNKYIAAELAYIDGGTAEASIPVLFDGILDRVKVEPSAINVQVVGLLPFNERFGAMARAGVSFVDTDVSIRFGIDNSVVKLNDNTEEFAFGVGLWAAPLPNLLIRLEYEASEASFEDVGVDTVGDVFGVDTDLEFRVISLSAVYKFAL